jgi:hypothetical protein
VKFVFTKILTAPLFVVVKDLKQLKYPSIKAQLNNLFIQSNTIISVKYYAAVKKNGKE